jgi:hypothetical protein
VLGRKRDCSQLLTVVAITKWPEHPRIPDSRGSETLIGYEDMNFSMIRGLLTQAHLFFLAWNMARMFSSSEFLLQGPISAFVWGTAIGTKH